MTTSPLFTGECRTTFFNSSIQAKFNPFGMASLVFTGHLLSSAPSIQTVEVMTRFGFVNSSLPYFSPLGQDRKSTRLNSSHANISYAVFCLKKKNNSLNKIQYN